MSPPLTHAEHQLSQGSLGGKEGRQKVIPGKPTPGIGDTGVVREGTRKMQAD